MADTTQRSPGRPRKIVVEQPAQPATEPVAPAEYRTRYEVGERPQVCRACASPDSRVLRTHTAAGIVFRRRQCKACGAVWMSRTNLAG